MNYPIYHKQIIKDLLDGKFILSNDKLYQTLKDNDTFYEEFFAESFDYQLIIKTDYAYLVGEESNEMLSRDISIFFGVLSYELDKDGRNFLDLIQYSEFEMSAVDNYFDNSNYKELINSNKQLKDKDSRRTFFNSLNRRNIIVKTAEDKFVFTSAYKVFTEFATELAKSKIHSMNENDERLN